MNKKLIFLDVDGTLTPPGGYVPPESALKAIRAAQDNGHKVFLCSGRNYGMLKPLLKHGFDGTITSCGGFVTSGDEVLYDCPLTEEQKETAITLFKENGVNLTIEGRDASFCDEGPDRLRESEPAGNSELINWIKAVWVDLGPRPMEEYDGRPIYKMVFICTDTDQLKPARAALEDQLVFILHDYSDPDCYFGEIVNRKFDKGSAVRLVTDKLGFEIADTIGFGDSMNDLEMIETVGTSVCMDSGSPRLKELSDMICPSVYDDGIEWGFRELGLI